MFERGISRFEFRKCCVTSLLGFSLFISILVGANLDAAPPISKIKSDVAQIELQGRDSSWQILIEGLRDQNVVDLTQDSIYKSRNPAIVEVNSKGHVRARGDGRTIVDVAYQGGQLELPVTVAGSAESRPLNFENDIIPIFNRYGCNSSGCHGKAEGQNGFKLSVFGFDPPADYQALVMEGRGRRVFPASPERSLLLQKISGVSPHGGGVRIDIDRPEYHLLYEWIRSGLPLGSEDDPRVEQVEITPKQRQLTMGQTQQLRVVAMMSDGRKMDVTQLAQFQSNNDGLATVNEAGFITAGQSPGSVAVMATYLGHVDVFQALIPQNKPVATDQKLIEHNFIDPLVHEKLRKLNIVPSGPANDADFLRRVYLDIIGTLPKAAEARQFLEDQRPDRRKRLVDGWCRRSCRTICYG